MYAAMFYVLCAHGRILVHCALYTDILGRRLATSLWPSDLPFDEPCLSPSGLRSFSKALSVGVVCGVRITFRI